VLWDMKARPNSPDWLVEETATIRKGLLTLRQNLVLLRDPENPEALYPRCAPVFAPNFPQRSPGSAAGP
jgi:4-alpha-glucanotransferase